MIPKVIDRSFEGIDARIEALDGRVLALARLMEDAYKRIATLELQMAAIDPHLRGG